MKGHTGVVNSIDTLNKRNMSSEILASASDDFTVKMWDERVRNFVSSYELDY